jgi:hypothetical protein
LEGIGKFMQGSGFTREDAGKVAACMTDVNWHTLVMFVDTLLEDVIENPERLERAQQLLRNHIKDRFGWEEL